MKRILFFLIVWISINPLIFSRENESFLQLITESERLWAEKDFSGALRKLASSASLISPGNKAEQNLYVKMHLKISAEMDDHHHLVSLTKELCRNFSDSELATILADLKNTLATAKRNPLARKVLKAALDAFPENTAIFKEFSHFYLKTGYLKDASAFYEGIVERESLKNPDNPAFRDNLEVLSENKPYRDSPLADIYFEPEYRYIIVKQDQNYEIDPKNKVFKSEQTYSIRNSAKEKSNKIHFTLHPQLQVKSVVIKNAAGNEIPQLGMRHITFDAVYRRCWPTFEIETANMIEPEELLEFFIRYQLNPDAVLEQPRKFAEFTVSPLASYSVYPMGGNNVLFGLNLSSPLTMKIKYAAGNHTSAPGSRLSTEMAGSFCIDSYESKSRNIPVFTCAPYRKTERNNGELSVEFLLYPHEPAPDEIVDDLFSVVGLYRDLFGDNQTNSYRIVTTGPYQSHSGAGENKGNCIFMSDNYLQDAMKTREGKWDYVATLFHEFFHHWNLFSITWDGDCAEWFGEGGASFVQAWAAERILGHEAARFVRKAYLDTYMNFKTHEALSVLRKATKASRSEISLIYYYGALVWEQLRQKLGDEVFFKGYADFFRNNLHKTVNYDGLVACWAPYTNQDIGSYLSQWLDHNSRISMSIEQVDLKKENNRYLVNVTVNVQSDLDYELFSGLEYRTEADDRSIRIPLHFTKRGVQNLKFECSGAPRFIQLDPQYTVPVISNKNMIWEQK